MEKKNLTGLAYVVVANLLWGIQPIFWARFKVLNPIFIMAQRVIWSAIIMMIVIFIKNEWHLVRIALSNKKKFFQFLLGGMLLVVTWGVYIAAVTSNRVLEASIGAFMMPVFSVLLSVFCLRERLTKFSAIMLCCGIVGIVVFIFSVDSFPVLGVIFGITFSLYGLYKKTITAPSEVSVFLETMLMSIFAVIYIVVSEKNGFGSRGHYSGLRSLIFATFGLVTAIPLLIYGVGVPKIPYQLTGILSYINPTMQFLVGIFILLEKINYTKLTAFIIIWVGLVVFSVGTVKNIGRGK